MEIHTPCSADGCRERIVASGDASLLIANIDRVLKANGWETRRNERGKKESYCPGHAHLAYPGFSSGA